MNVLVYSGPGTTTESVKHCLESLRHHLSPFYAVIAVSESTLLNDPWMHKSSLLVLPGGADLPYCKTFNGMGNTKISQFVRKGGKFIGFCAGGYYGASRVEFECGLSLEVSGSRELSFFPGIANGCAFKGFQYNSHEGARVVPLAVNSAALPESPEKVFNYYNGGGVFLNASLYPNTEILARYTDTLDVEDDDKAAVIHCKVGKGDVLLTGTHPEFSSAIMKPDIDDLRFKLVAEELSNKEEGVRLFLKSCLKRIGLKVNEDINFLVPRITPLLLSSHLDPSKVNNLITSLKNTLPFEGNTLHDLNDTFEFHDESEDDHSYYITEHNSNDLNDIVKHVKVFSKGNLPQPKESPYFNMSAYFSHLQELSKGEDIDVGPIFAYGEVVTSTNTLLEANPQLLRSLPHGFTISATTQVAGKGRNGNVWINPKGVMAVSTLIKIPGGPQNTQLVVTLQYLLSLALVELILGYKSTQHGKGVGYEDMPVKIKWPNDLYILKPEYFNNLNDKNEIGKTVEGDDERYAKISGAMINTQFFDNVFHLVWGAGVNVSNAAPTTSLDLVLKKLNQIRQEKNLPPLPPYQHEILLAKVCCTVDKFFKTFIKTGLKPFLPLYYERWMHSNQIVSIDVHGNGHNRKCSIEGISPDYGLLLVKDINTGEEFSMQPDGNSFDIFKGLVYKKN